MIYSFYTGRGDGTETLISDISGLINLTKDNGPRRLRLVNTDTVNSEAV